MYFVPLDTTYTIKLVPTILKESEPESDTDFIPNTKPKIK